MGGCAGVCGAVAAGVEVIFVLIFYFGIFMMNFLLTLVGWVIGRGLDFYSAKIKKK